MRRHGIDPRAHREEQIQARRIAAEAARLAEQNRITLRALFDRWATTELQPRIRTDGKRVGRKDGGKFTRDQFARRVFPVLGDESVETIKKAELLAILDSVKAEGKARTANVVFTDLKQMFRFALARDIIQRKTKERHLLAAAALCRAHGLTQLKLYMMLGLPGETEADIDELGRFSLELARVAPRVALGIAPFVAKRNTPLDGSGFEAIEVIDAKLARLRAAVRGRVTLRPTSPKWAWVEYRLAQGGFEAGRAAAVAARAGGRFSDWKAAFAEVPEPAVAPATRHDRLPLAL